MKIKALSDIVISQIAAGEVVERPSSIIKEIIENSLDAHADRIYIQVEEGGQKKILLIDNGDGIDFEDLPYVFKRHATSKFSEMNDFNSLSSFGFRGEALASISSVSQITLETATQEGEGVGYRMKLNGGEVILEPTVIGRSRGTTLLIENLFYNTPARKKFLKSPRSEMTLITEIVTKFALLHPNIQFVLEQKGKELVRTLPSSHSLHNIKMIYGAETAENMLEVNFDKNNIHISGYVSNSKVSKRTKKHQSISVNGRIIENPVLFQAIEEGARQYMPPGLNPVVVLNIDMQNQELDVNAHPRKEYVRFQNEEKVSDALREAVNDSLRILQSEEQQIDEENFFKAYALSEPWKEAIDFKILGQLQNTYIIADIFDKIMFIDQHAAHEAIIYHYLKESVLYKRGDMPREELEKAMVLTLTPSQDVMIEKHISDIQSMGFSVEKFGERTLIIREIPKGVDKEKVKIIIEEILNEGISNKTDWLKNALIMTSCKSAIKANQHLEQSVMEYMIKELILNQITNCPHGRPLYFTMSVQELERKFNRVV